MSDGLAAFGGYEDDLSSLCVSLCFCKQLTGPKKSFSNKIPCPEERKENINRKYTTSRNIIVSIISKITGKSFLTRCVCQIIFQHFSGAAL